MSARSAPVEKSWSRSIWWRFSSNGSRIGERSMGFGSIGWKDTRQCVGHFHRDTCSARGAPWHPSSLRRVCICWPEKMHRNANRNSLDRLGLLRPNLDRDCRIAGWPWMILCASDEHATTFAALSTSATARSNRSAKIKSDISQHPAVCRSCTADVSLGGTFADPISGFDSRIGWHGRGGYC